MANDSLDLKLSADLTNPYHARVNISELVQARKRKVKALWMPKARAELVTFNDSFPVSVQDLWTPRQTTSLAAPWRTAAMESPLSSAL